MKPLRDEMPYTRPARASRVCGIMYRNLGSGLMPNGSLVRWKKLLYISVNFRHLHPFRSLEEAARASIPFRGGTGVFESGQANDRDGRQPGERYNIALRTDGGVFIFEQRRNREPES